jgi:hypothetical protein
MPRMRSLVPTIFVLLVAASAAADRAAHAGDDCLRGPNASAPQGKHWYYRLDRAAHRKCWYLGPWSARVVQRAVPTTRKPAPRRVAPVEAPRASAQPVAPRAPSSGETAAVASPPAAETVANAAFESPSADAADVVAPEPDGVQQTTRVPGPIAARPGSAMGERAPAQPARQASPVTSEPTALRAVLASVALLLAVVGVILIRAARRALRGTDEVAMPAYTGIRRGTREFPAPAVTDEEGPRFAAPTPATFGAALQPDVNPMSPEAIDIAPDVEQSLRQLPRVREGLAA